MAIAIALVIVVVGSVLFHLLSPWWWTPIASNWSYIDHTLSITFWITGIVFAAVVLFMAYCVFRFRHREGARAHYEPENKRLEFWLTVVTAVGVAAMLTPGLFVWANFVTVPDEATDVEVVAQQWQWSYRLPGADGRLGRSDPRLIGPDNPLGVDPDDPDGADDVIVEAERPAPADRSAGQGAAALDRRAARLLRAGVPRQDGHGAGDDHLLLVHPHPHRRVRGALRRALRHGARLHARHRATSTATTDYQAWLGEQSTFAELAQPTRLGAAEPMR